MYGLQANGIAQGLGASAAGSMGTILTFAMFELPNSGSGPSNELSTFLHTMVMSGLVSLSFICFIVALRLVVRRRTE